jgi:hypothetical protein
MYQTACSDHEESRSISVCCPVWCGCRSIELCGLAVQGQIALVHASSVMLEAIRLAQVRYIFVIRLVIMIFFAIQTWMVLKSRSYIWLMQGL